MPRISIEEESTIDWDWYAYDSDGNIGHFTSAGLRALPEKVRADIDQSHKLIRFFHELPDRSDLKLSDRVQRELLTIADPSKREWRVRDFATAARKGLFSFDTEHGSPNYFLVAAPQAPLSIDSIPLDIRDGMVRIADGEFLMRALTISEDATVRW